MALEIEDGTGKANATSVASVADVRNYAAARGLSVPASGAPGDTQIEQALIKAMDYLTIKVGCYQGEESVEGQALPFPRDGVYIKGKLQADNYMPNSFKTAQILLALEVLNGVSLMPNASNNASDYVIKEVVGPIETEYADPTKFSGQPSFVAVESLLAPLLGSECATSSLSFGVYRG